MGFTVLGTPLDYLLPKEEMLDSMSHADAFGTAKDFKNGGAGYTRSNSLSARETVTVRQRALSGLEILTI